MPFSRPVMMPAPAVPAPDTPAGGAVDDHLFGPERGRVQVEAGGAKVGQRLAKGGKG